MFFKNQANLGYLYFKGLMSMIYSDDFSQSALDFQSVLDINDDYLLYALKGYLNIWNDTIDQNTKNNIYSLVELWRNNLDQIEDNNRIIERSNMMNEILCLTNQAQTTHIAYFLFSELYKRYNSKFMAIKILSQIPQNELMQYMGFCIQDDFYILYTHSDIVSDEEFDRGIDQFVHRNIDYILNINNLTNELASLYTDKTFMKRVSKVVKMIESEFTYEKISLFGKAGVKPQKMIKKLEKRLSKYNV